MMAEDVTCGPDGMCIQGETLAALEELARELAVREARAERRPKAEGEA
jgi:hypothetical protein